MTDDSSDIELAVPPKTTKPQAVTWITERNVAAAALSRAGATAREARVLATSGDRAAKALCVLARKGVGDMDTVDDRAALAVLAAHRAAANPDWLI